MTHVIEPKQAGAKYAQVVRLPLPKVAPGSQAALLVLARYSAAWLRANPGASVDEHLHAAAEIARELGL